MTVVTPTENQKALGAALGKIASGVHIVTASQGDKQGGMIASWVMQAGFEPPSVTLAMTPDRYVAELIQQSGRCVVNVLADKQYGLMKPFGKGTDDAFAELDTQSSQHGIILKEAVAYLELVVVDKLTGKTDHDVYLTHVVGGAVLNADAKPMTHTRPSGFQY